MKLSIILATTDFRGDHATDVRLVFEPVPNETIWQLVDRVARLTDKPLSALDVVEIRPVIEESVIEAPPGGLIR